MRFDANISKTNPVTASANGSQWAAEARVKFTAASCLPVRFSGYECGLCATACPVSAIRLKQGIPALASDCLGCGQCVASCPSGALTVSGFDPPADAVAGTDEVCIDCWRVPFGASPAGALRVPCLAGLGTGSLVSLCDGSGEKPIHLIDRGYCGNCTVGAGMQALRATLTEARGLLFASGVPLHNLPGIIFVPSRETPLPVIPEAASTVRMGRRSFFRNLAGGVARGAEQIRQPLLATETPIVLRETSQPIERLRMATALASIARRHGRAVPSQALPLVSLSECSGHGICASVCPTGALVREETGTVAELQFFAARCIACGQCARTCPDRALRVTPSGGNALFEVLARWEAHTCPECSETHFGAGGASCPTCAKKQALSLDFAALFKPHV